MLRRSGPNVHYTHDAVAALVALRAAAEFAHGLDADLAACVVDHEPFAPNYCVDLTDGYAWRRGTYYNEESRLRAGEIAIVPLYRFQNLYENARDRFGFSCMICRHPQPYADRARSPHWHIDTRVAAQQIAIGPALVCSVCADLFWLVLTGDGMFVKDKQSRYAEQRVRDYRDRLRTAPASRARPLPVAEARRLLRDAGMPATAMAPDTWPSTEAPLPAAG